MAAAGATLCVAYLYMYVGATLCVAYLYMYVGATLCVTYLYMYVGATLCVAYHRYLYMYMYVQVRKLTCRHCTFPEGNGTLIRQINVIGELITKLSLVFLSLW